QRAGTASLQLRDSLAGLERKIAQFFQPLAQRAQRLIAGTFLGRQNDRMTEKSSKFVLAFHSRILQPGTAWRWNAILAVPIAFFCALGWPGAAMAVVAYPLLIGMILSILYMRLGFALNDEAD